jgi:biopolymer transport protein ExbD
MVTGTFRRAGEMELRLPESSTAAPVGEGVQSHQGELVLREDGSVLLNGEVVPAAELPVRLRAFRETDEEARILLKAEAGARHGEVVHLLDLVREAGFPGVAIGTEIRTFQDQEQ